MHLLYILADPRSGFVRYVGKTSRGDLGRRRREHLQPSSLRHKTHKNHWLRELLAEGVEPVVDLLEAHNTVEALDAAETFFIDYLRYVGCDLTNLAAGGTGLRKGSRMSQETRRRMSEAHTGKTAPKSAGWREKLRLANLGKKMTPATRQRMSDSHRALLKVNPRKSRKVLNVTTGKTYPSAKAASEAAGVALGSVWMVAQGRWSQVKGLVFSWMD
jgi:hypothetical protein